MLLQSRKSGIFEQCQRLNWKIMWKFSWGIIDFRLLIKFLMAIAIYVSQEVQNHSQNQNYYQPELELTAVFDGDRQMLKS